MSESDKQHLYIHDLKPLIVPCINNNGNTAESLIGQLREVMSAIAAVEKSLTAASDCWHGRNFQTVGAPEYARKTAEDAWFQRFNLLRDLYNDVLNVALAIQEQGRER